MPVSEYASINPDLLRWAREVSGYDVAEAAQKMQIKPERLVAAETFTDMLTIAQLRRVAEVYKRPVDIFYLPDPPEQLPAPRDFRTLGNQPSQQANLSPKLRLEWRRAFLKRKTALELFAEQGEQPQPIQLTARLDEEPEVIARRVTAWLNIPSENLPYNREPRKMLNAWIGIIEKKGVLVFQSSRFDVNEARGLSYGLDQLPFILLNGKDQPRPRLFTLLHEFVHLLLGQSGAACNPLLGSMNVNPTESFCNKVAAAIIIPRESILSEAASLGLTSSESLDEGDIQYLANLYGCSRQVLLIRLLDMGLAANTFVQSLLDTYENEFKSSYANEDAVPNNSPGGPPRFRMALRDNGRKFCRLVLDALDAQHISELDAADYLELKPYHFERVRNALEGDEVQV